MGIDFLSVLATGFYIFLVDPFELRPLTLVERQILCLEVAVVFVAFRAGLKRGMNPPSNPETERYSPGVAPLIERAPA
jgi:hypothetical protein